MQEHPWHQFWTRSVDAATGVAGSAESMAAWPVRWWHDSYKASHDWWVWWMTAWAAGTQPAGTQPAGDETPADEPAAAGRDPAWPARRADVQYVVEQPDTVASVPAPPRKARTAKARGPGEDRV